MRRFIPYSFLQCLALASFFLISFISNAQILQVEILGGAVVTQGSTVTINAGSSLTFRATNVETGNCGQLHIQDIDISNTSDFDISPNNPSDKIKPSSCSGDKYLDFEIENDSGSCASTSTLVTIEIKNQSDFTFTLQVNSSPEIYVLGGSPFADIIHGDTDTSDKNGTYFGDVDEGASVTRRFIVANVGSCDMNITSVTSNNPDFTASSIFGIPYNNLPSGYGIYVDVTFTAPTGGIGTQSATISVFTNDPDTNPFFLNVSAEMFKENIPGPGGITSSFKLWLKSTRGIVKSGSAVTNWLDLGTNSKNATTVAGKEPTYIDTPEADINFNPVIKFENDGGSLEQYMFNNDSPISGFYNHDIFVVMVPDATMNSGSGRNTIFAGVDSGNVGDMTGVGFGDYSSKFTGETLSYNQDVPAGGSYNGEAQIGSSYSNAGIINVRNDAAISPTKQDILYNSNVLTTSNVSEVAFSNIVGSEYWIGRNQDVQGSLNGRVAEVFTFAERLSDLDRQKVESYLAIKYGITLGATNEAQKNYVNSFDTTVWDISANAGFNYDITGIARDSISDLNQKQSKTINSDNGITIGLGGIFSTNSANPNEFEDDGDFLVWGNDNGAYTGTNSDVVTIAPGVTTSFTRIDRKWKIVETSEDINGDVESVCVGIPITAFSGFTKTANEEYALIVADNPAFASANIIDIVPLQINVDELGVPILDNNGNQVYKTWYDFHDTNYFTFGKVPKRIENKSASISTGEYLVGEVAMNLNANAFAVSAWVKSSPSANIRTIMAKGSKLQLRLNTSNQVEVTLDDLLTAKFTSTTTISDNKWHQITFVYKSGTIFLYIDGVLDHSEQNVIAPSPNFNHFSVGAVYENKHSILNPFLGEIDEIYIWNQALSEAQVRFLMNQEVERFDVSGTDYVTGKVIPYGSASNEVAAIPWSDLEVYYDFNSFYGTTIEGLAETRQFLRLKYLDKDKVLLDNQTAPLPYVSATIGDWDTGATWTNNTNQNIPNSLSLDGVTQIDWNIVELNHDIVSGDRNIKVLGLISNSGILTIADPNDAPDQTNSGQSLTISHYLELDGVIDLVGESQLIQTKGSIVDADSGGYLERDQQGTANGFNYNYWSSSVSPAGGNTATKGNGVSNSNPNHSISEVLNDGTNSGIYQPILFSTSPNGSGSIPPVGFARTISTQWLYKFYGTADDYYAWAKIDESTPLQAGEGYTMKGTGGAATIPISIRQNYVFKGLPNNGDISLALDNSTQEVERLIGNPYPSAIDASDFILDNISVADGGNNTTGNVINGALYFWDHFGQANSHVLKNYVGGYATRNLTGGAAAISNDIRINDNLATGTNIPGPYIAVNQGFFVSTVLDGFNNANGTPIVTVSGGNIEFKNSQRAYVTELDESTPGVYESVFMKSSKEKTANKATENEIKVNNPIIRLMYESPLGYHRQIVIGSNKNASNNFDLGYDAFMVDVNEEDMYWTINNNKFVIQGVGDFNSLQEFSLGLIVKKAGNVKIKLNAIENMQANSPVFIKDTTTDELFKINNNAFELYLEAGVYNDRFKLVFQSIQESEENNETIEAVDTSTQAEFISDTSEFRVINKDNIDIKDISVFNIFGQKVKFLEVNIKTDVSIPLELYTGIYIVKVKTARGVVNKKIIVK